MAMTVVGLALFVSVFFSGPKLDSGASPEDPDFWQRAQKNHREFGETMHSDMVRAFVGMGIMMLGGILTKVGRHGAAGAGLILDPEQARKDVEPWSRAAGGMANDALSEVDLARKIGEGLGNPKPHVKVRCRKCQALSDETAKFCGQCGERL
jgi:hypothetical protein